MFCGGLKVFCRYLWLCSYARFHIFPYSFLWQPPSLVSLIFVCGFSTLRLHPFSKFGFAWHLFSIPPFVSPSDTFVLLFPQLNFYTPHSRGWLSVLISVLCSAAQLSVSFCFCVSLPPTTTALLWAVAAIIRLSISHTDLWAILLSVK